MAGEPFARLSTVARMMPHAAATTRRRVVAVRAVVLGCARAFSARLFSHSVHVSALCFTPLSSEEIQAVCYVAIFLCEMPKYIVAIYGRRAPREHSLRYERCIEPRTPITLMDVARTLSEVTRSRTAYARAESSPSVSGMADSSWLAAMLRKCARVLRLMTARSREVVSMSWCRARPRRVLARVYVGISTRCSSAARCAAACVRRHLQGVANCCWRRGSVARSCYALPCWRCRGRPPTGFSDVQSRCR